jgi:two-component system phosphate regulon sensor histidine kinase PhoR
MQRDYWRLAAAATIGLLAGLLSGHVFLFLSLTLLALLLWYLRALHGFLNYARHGAEDNVPEIPGVVEALIREFNQLRDRFLQREAKLGGFLRRFQEAAAALPDAVLVLDQDDRIEWANRRAADYLGVHWPRDRHQRLVNLIRQPQLHQHLRNGDEAASAAALTMPSPENRDLMLEVRALPYGDGLRLLIVQDVTAIHQSNRVRRDFIANASHELRTPLTVIAGYLEHFENDPGLCTPQALPQVRQMRVQTRRMQRLIDDLLQLSSLETAELPKSTDTVIVADMLAGIVREAEAVSGGQQHAFRQEYAPDLCLRGNQRELYSAFSNLVFNAVQYTPAGGSVGVRWYRDDRGGHMEVSDTGEGIAPEHIPRLTERFYRVDKSRSREKGGTGLGLAIVKHVLARHGAWLHIESQPGRGSTFRCDFPATALAERPPMAG